MIDQNLLDAVKSYSENMTRPITFVLGNGTHVKRAELVDFLTKIAGTTDKINFDAEATDDSLPSAISFKVV
ncbi:alkyl hydroperoxide reductase subunit F, partial [Pseudoalteromonas sp. SIMBA_153]